jgi:hypothetical protein
MAWGNKERLTADCLRLLIVSNMYVLVQFVEIEDWTYDGITAMNASIKIPHRSIWSD